MHLKHATLATFLAAGLLAACSGGGGGSPSPGPTPTPKVTAGNPTPTPAVTPTPAITPTPVVTPTPTAAPTATPTPVPTVAGLPVQLNLEYPLFYGQTIASFASINPGFPRQLVALPNGDLLVGTGSPFVSNNQVYIIPNADGPSFAGTPAVFATLTDGTCGDTRSLKENAQGIAFAPSGSGGTIFVGMECAVFAIPYTTGDKTARPATKIVAVRQGSIVNFATDGDVHHTTSVAVSGSNLYIGVGSSCNACTETDPTRAVVLRTNFSGGSMVTIAKRFRNPLALAVSSSGAVWAGGAGQDCAVTSVVTAPATPPPTCAAMDSDYGVGTADTGHPFEFIDPVTKRYASNGNSTADYFWPYCEENKWPVFPGSCSSMFTRLVQTPAYNTLESAVFYPAYSGTPPAYAFPSAYQGGLFLSLHGSWHETTGGIFVAPPRIVYIPMNGDTPVSPQTWGPAGQPGGDPFSTWGTKGGNPVAFLDGYQDPSSGLRVGRPTGLAVGPNGSMFIADDGSGAIYRIRYGTPPSPSARAVAKPRSERH
jgi:glucose/arabinose dehydrogenase